MKTRPALVAAYAAAAIACIAIVAMLFKTWGPVTTPRKAPTSINMAQALQGRLAHATREQVRVSDLYQARGFSTVWFEGDQLSSDGRRVMAILADAGADGLPAASYRLPAMPDAHAADTIKAEFDLALTIAALRYATDRRDDAWSGMEFALSVDNAFDRDPPLYQVGSPLYAAPYDSTNYSAIGRFLSLSVSKHW